MIRKILLIVLSCTLLVGFSGQEVQRGATRHAAFVPPVTSPVAGMYFWFSADCITFPSSVCGIPSNGTSISAWADRSGNNRNWSRSSGTCTFNTNQINSLPAVTFSSCYGSMGSVTANAIHSVFVVQKSTAGGYLLGTNSLGQFAYVPPSSAAQAVIAQDQSNPCVATVAPGAVFVQSSVQHQNSVGCTFRINSATDTSTVNTGVIFGSNGPDTLGADGRTPSSGPFSGQLVEIIYYQFILNTTQIQQNEAYFRQKYGIS